jgi:hypothetical protein
VLGGVSDESILELFWILLEWMGVLMGMSRDLDVHGGSRLEAGRELWGWIESVMIRCRGRIRGGSWVRFIPREGGGDVNE